jgi:hypothetical protein
MATDGAGRWRLTAPIAALAVLVVLVAGGVVLWTQRGHSAGTGGPSASPAPSLGMVMQSPTCSPQIVDSGYSSSGGDVLYGLIVRNACPYASVGNTISVSLLDPAGKKINDDRYGKGVVISVLLPGQETGIAGAAGLTDRAATIGSLRASVTSNHLLPAGVFARWPRSVTVRDLAVERYEHNTGSVTAAVSTDPPEVPLCLPRADLIVRDSGGKIISGYETNVVAYRLSLKFTFPPATDYSKLEIHINQGGPGIGMDAAAVAASYACE